MSRPAGRRFYARKWLNKPGHETAAFILAEVGRSDDRWLDTTLMIGDCDRKIQLNFTSAWGSQREASHANNLFKIDTLIDVLTRFRGALADEQDRITKRVEATGEEEEDE